VLPNRKLRPDISTRIGTPPAGVGYAGTTTVEQKADLERAPEPGTGTV
jgi:hypothetical protein